MARLLSSGCGGSTRLVAACLLAILVAATAGCGGRYIKGTKIRDTEENRSILVLLEKYQRAMEAKDVESILSIVSPTYHEGMGTFGGEDDYGYAELRERLVNRFSKLRSIRYVVKVTRISVEGVRAEVFYTYDMRYQFSLSAHDEWSSEVDDHRMLLERTETGWLVVAGL